MMDGKEREYYINWAMLKSFKKRVAEAEKIIEDALGKTEKFMISCSYGKDSLVLLDLVFRKTDKCKVIQSDSGYQLPETYEVREYCEKIYGYKTIILPQLMRFEDFLKEYGLPDINRTKAQHKKVVEITKKNRLDDLAIQHGAEGIFWGLRKEESKGRTMLLCKEKIYYNKNRELWFAAPLADWTANDVWAYIVANDLKYPEFYDRQNCGMTRAWIRNSSWVSTDGATRGKLVWLKYNYPEYFNELAEKFPEVKGYV